ncbi:endonuclease/exonuclease/phosphatase family protein [Gimesia fumaroli]|uniref:Endonuclease/Exonuclease/phosphatase family protein n=1 Tax=Gimesia fumaroli TaxID=2527976 RepID=A0A518IE87_9PLAN|nr:endonuclease/exonuclease/phosphatase family protein [Gimesia fumaroli]QDV51377.1 Endonuclease/Exonuclease/phosphatase family protein [Gimesia fumaroli]
MIISRRQFCAALGAAGIAATVLPVSAADKQTAPLRVITYNVFGCRGWPANRPLARKAVAKDQMLKRISMELALYEPDIINFSESPSEAVTKAIAKVLRMNHVRFPSGGNWPGTLLSRFEITDSENVPLGYERPKDLFTRHWGRGTIKLPNGAPLVVHSAHLYPVADPTIRLKEIKAMLASMQGDFDSGHSVLLIGDLNHSPDTEEYQLWKEAGWVDTFAKVGKGEGITFQADVKNERIDYVMAYGPIANQIVESRPLFEGAFRLNLADENSFALSDHLPQLAVFGEKN